MASLFGIDIAGIIHRIVSPGVHPGTLVRRASGPRDPLDLSDGVSIVETTHSFRGIMEEYDDRRIDGDIVRVGDRKVLLTANSLSPPTTPQVSDFVQMEGREMTVVNVQRDPATATFTLQVR